MFVDSAIIDDSDLEVEQVVSGDRLNGGTIEQLIRSLDGHRRTLLMLKATGDNQMAIGGGEDGQFIVYATDDNAHFRTLVTANPRFVGSVTIVAGGQPGDYDGRYVVTLDEAIAAARSYSADGLLSTALEWDRV